MFKYLCALLLTALPAFAFAAPKADASFAGQQFPMAMYAVPGTDANFSQMREMGIDYVHLYGLSKGPLSDEAFGRIQAYLDLARKYDLKVMFDLDGYRRVPNELEEMRTVVRRFKDHPALGFWYLYDEPDNHKITVEKLTPFYEMVKAETPHIPVAVCHAWTANWYRFKDVQDILMHDIYPITGAPFPQAKLEQQTKFTRGALKLNETVIPALQFFNWQSMAKPDETTLRKYPVAELRYPTTEELRYLCFSTIAQGVRGLAFYSFLRSEMTDPQWATRTAVPVLREVREFTDGLKKNDFVQQSHDADKDQLILSVWQSEQQTYVILANASPEARRLEYSVEKNLTDGQLQPWGATRKTEAALSGGKITVENAQPWEIFIWSLTP